MEPRVNVITLAADDLERSLRFYRDGLGLETAGVIGTEFEAVTDVASTGLGCSLIVLPPRRCGLLRCAALVRAVVRRLLRGADEPISTCAIR